MSEATRDARNAVVRVCVDARALDTGHRQRGIGTYVSSLIAHEEDGRPFAQSSGEPGMEIRIGYLRAPASPSGRLPARDRRATLAGAECDIYHATTLEGISFSPAYKTVVTLYDLIPSQQATWRTWVRRPLHHLTYLRQIRRVAQAEHVIAISEATKRDARKLLGIPPERISVIAPALDSERVYVPSSAQCDAAQSALGLREPYFLAVASSEPHKNLARVIEAFAAFCAASAGDGPADGYRLYFAGTWMGREARRLLGLIQRHGLGEMTVRLPWVPAEHLPAVYHGATALIFPSLIEGFGLPVLEAMASGTAVITSNRSSLPEVAGDAALYVNPEQVGEIVAAMHTLATRPDLRAELLARGRERCQLFSQERASHALLDLYRRVATQESTTLEGTTQESTTLEWPRDRSRAGGRR